MRWFVNCSFIFLTVFGGCQKGTKNDNSSTQDLILLNIKDFPEELAGRWVEKQPKYGWQFVLTKEGKISEIVHAMGLVKVIPGETNRYPLIEEGTGIINPGKIAVQFDKGSMELAIEIEIERFRWVKRDDIVEGNRKDLFIGKVSDDYKMWDVEWLDKEFYVADTGEIKGKVLTQDPDLKERASIVFVRQSE